jgi:hypothetical protein
VVTVHLALPGDPIVKTSVSSPSPTGIRFRPMPVHRSKDSDGPYYQWGESGKKYRYEAGNEKSRKKAKEKAKRQGRAARASGYRG